MDTCNHGTDRTVAKNKYFEHFCPKIPGNYIVYILKSLISLVLNVKKSISSIFDGRSCQNGLSSGQCFSLNTKTLHTGLSEEKIWKTRTANCLRK